MSEMGDRIRQCRIDAGLSQSEVAKLAGISQQSISTYEKGTRIPLAPAIIALARTYDVSTDYLLGITDVRMPFPKEE